MAFAVMVVGALAACSKADVPPGRHGAPPTSTTTTPLPAIPGYYCISANSSGEVTYSPMTGPDGPCPPEEDDAAASP